MIYIVLFSFIALVFFVRLLVNTFYALWLWQVKEYRFDRMLVALRDTKEGRRFLINKKTFVLSILFVLAPFIDVTMLWYTSLVAIVFAIDLLGIFHDIRTRTTRRPKLSVKVILIAVISCFMLALILSMTTLAYPAKIVFADRLIFPILSLVVLGMYIPTFFVKVILMEMTRRKRERMENLIVIGVTGSYGKSTTKELIADFLSEKYKVLKTPGSVNTDLGIAQFVLKNLKSEHEVLVVEIGAYKQGEIASVCAMVKPTVGVLTGINEQHLALFGGIENTKKAKMELIENLPENGMAFFNGDDPISFDLSKHRKKHTFVYSADQLPAALRKGKNQFLTNIAGAYMVAIKLGVEPLKLLDRARKAIFSFGLSVKKMGNAIILDDIFNTNPNGFSAALTKLAEYKGKKVLVTPGIIELGNESDRIHRELGEKIGTICDVVVLTNDNFEKPISEGLLKTKFDVQNLLTPKREELISIVRNIMKEKTVLLLEGRVPKEVANQLINYV